MTATGQCPMYHAQPLLDLLNQASATVNTPHQQRQQQCQLHHQQQPHNHQALQYQQLLALTPQQQVFTAMKLEEK